MNPYRYFLVALLMLGFLRLSQTVAAMLRTPAFDLGISIPGTDELLDDDERVTKEKPNPSAPH